MFKRRTEAEINELKRKYSLQIRKQGKNRFIWREGVLMGLGTWFVSVVAVDAFGDHSHSSLQSYVYSALILLPICLLGGYLTGRWRWTDFEKKYPENSLPPWE